MSRFSEAVERGLKGVEFPSTGVCSGCSECADNLGISLRKLRATWSTGDHSGSLGFSWSECDLCGSSLGGDREAFHGYIRLPDKLGRMRRKLFHGAVCVDCVMYLAYGEEPEETDGDDNA